MGNWRKISPYQNLYDSQTVDYYWECLFDPTDDGNTEDDYDPTDPERRLGPSSTCHPEFVFSRVGAIFFSDTFDAQDIHHASAAGPGLQGSLGPGTWVESSSTSPATAGGACASAFSPLPSWCRSSQSRGRHAAGAELEPHRG